MVSDLDLAPPVLPVDESPPVEPTKRELIVVKLHTRRALDVIEEGRAIRTTIRPIFIDRLSGANRQRLINLIESSPIVSSANQHYTLRLKSDRGESVFVIDRISPE